jgi:hypothetical protein
MEKSENGGDKPPLLSSWRRLYVAVLLNLALQIFLFYLFTKAFR